MNTDQKDYAIARAINGIAINGKEYVRDHQEEVMLFSGLDAALLYLDDNGYPKAKALQDIDNGDLLIVAYED